MAKPDVLRSPAHVEHLLVAAGVPRVVAHVHAPYASHAMRLRGIGSHGDFEHRKREVLYFLAQGLHETGGLKWLAEFWGPTPAQRTYVGRMGNRTLAEAFEFRGGGVFQLTGRNNYIAYARKLHVPIDRHPELARAPRTAWMIAAQYWVDRDLGPLARSGNFLAVTKGINGGTNGLSSREAWLHALEHAK
jgi:putative chitinase